MYRSLALFVLIAVCPAIANADTLTHFVSGFDNLYNTPWGGSGNPYPDGIGTGLNATAVSSGGNPFNFAPFISVSITATGCAVDAYSDCTDADGFAGTLFRDLDVYSLIGLWSSTGLTITPIGSPFNVGTSETLFVPVGPASYLFLAENDGEFSDNSGGYFTTSITTGVPETPVWSLLAFGLVGIGMAWKAQRTSVMRLGTETL